MTSHGTPYDHLTMAELNDGIASGEISTLDLPHDLLSAWAAWEPEPVDLTLFALSNAEHRQQFLHQYCYQGEAALFAAVSHIWNSLAEPRQARCTAMGIAAGTGGKGKMALVLMLRKFLAEYLDAIGPPPRANEFSDVDGWHQAAMASFEEEEQRLQALCTSYAAILDGASPEGPSESRIQLIVGPWLFDHEPV